MYYVVAEVRAHENYKTKEITIKGLLGIAPNDSTPIVYPVVVYRFGYWNKTNTRKMMREVKRELLHSASDKGYGMHEFTQPLRMVDPWDWMR